MQVTLRLRAQQNSMLKHPEYPRAADERPSWLREELYLHPLASETSQRGFTLLHNCQSGNEGLLLASLSQSTERRCYFLLSTFDCRNVLL